MALTIPSPLPHLAIDNPLPIYSHILSHYQQLAACPYQDRLAHLQQISVGISMLPTHQEDKGKQLQYLVCELWAIYMGNVDKARDILEAIPNIGVYRGQVSSSLIGRDIEDSSNSAQIPNEPMGKILRRMWLAILECKWEEAQQIFRVCRELMVKNKAKERQSIMFLWRLVRLGDDANLMVSMTNCWENQFFLRCVQSHVNGNRMAPLLELVKKYNKGQGERAMPINRDKVNNRLRSKSKSPDRGGSKSSLNKLSKVVMDRSSGGKGLTSQLIELAIYLHEELGKGIAQERLFKLELQSTIDQMRLSHRPSKCLKQKMVFFIELMATLKKYQGITMEKYELSRIFAVMKLGRIIRKAEKTNQQYLEKEQQLLERKSKEINKNFFEQKDRWFLLNEEGGSLEAQMKKTIPNETIELLKSTYETLKSQRRQQPTNHSQLIEFTRDIEDEMYKFVTNMGKPQLYQAYYRITLYAESRKRQVSSNQRDYPPRQDAAFNNNNRYSQPINVSQPPSFKPTVIFEDQNQLDRQSPNMSPSMKDTRPMRDSLPPLQSSVQPIDSPILFGSKLTKVHAGKDGVQERYFFIRKDKPYRLYYADKQQETKDSTTYYDLKGLQDIKPGKDEQPFQRESCKKFSGNRCITLDMGATNPSRYFYVNDQRVMGPWMRILEDLRDKKIGKNAMQASLIMRPKEAQSEVAPLTFSQVVRK